MQKFEKYAIYISAYATVKILLKCRYVVKNKLQMALERCKT